MDLVCRPNASTVQSVLQGYTMPSSRTEPPVQQDKWGAFDVDQVWMLAFARFVGLGRMFISCGRDLTKAIANSRHASANGPHAVHAFALGF